MIKAYVATSLENQPIAKRLMRLLRLAGCEITYDWTEHGSVQDEGEERIREVADSELAGVLDADIVIVALPGGRGTHTELGIALGRRPVSKSDPVIVLWSMTPEELQDEAGRECSFYRSSRVRLVVDPHPEAAVEEAMRGTRTSFVRSAS